jgi:hypothetical protein
VSSVIEIDRLGVDVHDGAIIHHGCIEALDTPETLTHEPAVAARETRPSATRSRAHG